MRVKLFGIETIKGSQRHFRFTHYDIYNMVRMVIDVAKRRGKKIGICGQAPSDFPEFATFLVECGIDSISLIPDTVIKTRLAVAAKEKELGIKAD